MLKQSDYLVLLLLVTNSAVIAALTAQVNGFQLPPVLVFGLVVAQAPIMTVLAVLPGLGVRIPQPGPIAEPRAQQING